MYDKIAEADDKQWPMTAASVKGLDGLSSGHAYSVLGRVELKDEAGAILHRLIKIRNPWADEYYHGDWSDEDGKWTQSFREQAGSRIAKDGVFFVSDKHFVELFDNMQLVMYDEW